MTENSRELEVESKIDNLPEIEDFVFETLKCFGADSSIVDRVQLAMDEAVTNVIKHAYAGGSGKLRVSMKSEGDELIITLTDWGKPFDPNTVPPPDLESDLEHRRAGGLGIYFMKKLMDEVTYSFETDKGNRLVMKKRLK